MRIHRTVEHVPATTTRSVEHDEVEIERVRLDRLLDQPVEPWQDGEWLVVPVMEEVLVITKQLVLTEEVRIRTKRVSEEPACSNKVQNTTEKKHKITATMSLERASLSSPAIAQIGRPSIAST